MIRLYFTNCKWGTDPIDEGDGGVQINLLDEESQIMAHVPFTGDPLVDLTRELIEKMSPEQRQQLGGALNGEAPPEAPAEPPKRGNTRPRPGR